MRIDLHTHTRKVKKGESNERNISPENYISKMHKNNVQICAITNHNTFDIDEFNTINKKDPNLLIFPGIELDVQMLGESELKGHIIVIANPNIKTKFLEVFDSDPDRNYNDFYLDYKEFVHKIKSFDSDDLIIIPHFADKHKAIEQKTIKSLDKDLNEYVFILEPARLQTMGIINAHRELSLIGSDVQDWNKYSKKNYLKLNLK